MKFRKKPVVIDAFKWEPGVCFPGPEFTGLHSVARIESSTKYPHPDVLSIETPEGIVSASIGDWIIRGVKGEYYPCKPDIFEATYEVAE